MPEGDREFDRWLSNIQEILEAIDVPLIVKEVGFGMSRETVSRLQEIGVQYIDISGKVERTLPRLKISAATKKNSMA